MTKRVVPVSETYQFGPRKEDPLIGAPSVELLGKTSRGDPVVNHRERRNWVTLCEDQLHPSWESALCGSGRGDHLLDKILCPNSGP